MDVMHQTRFSIRADVGLHAEIVLVALLRLMHFRIALAFLFLGPTGRVDDGSVDNGALAQRPAAAHGVRAQSLR